MLDFSKEEKLHLDLKLKDGRLLCVYPPTLDMIGEFRKMDFENPDFEMARKVIAQILSNNMQKAKVMPSQIGELNMNEFSALIQAISDFVIEIQNQKN